LEKRDDPASSEVFVENGGTVFLLLVLVVVVVAFVVVDLWQTLFVKAFVFPMDVSRILPASLHKLLLVVDILTSPFAANAFEGLS